MRAKRVSNFVAEWTRPDCITLKNRGAIVGHIQKFDRGWKVFPTQAGRQPSRRFAETAAEAATRYFVPAAGQAVDLIEHSENGHDAPEKVTP